jgi:hypothetical protein
LSMIPNFSKYTTTLQMTEEEERKKVSNKK